MTNAVLHQMLNKVERCSEVDCNMKVYTRENKKIIRTFVFPIYLHKSRGWTSTSFFCIVSFLFDALFQRSTRLRIPSTQKVFIWSRNHFCTTWISSSLAIPGVSSPYSAFWILAHSDGPTFHLLWLFCSKFFFSLVHAASGTAMSTLSQQQGKWRDQGQTSITWPQ
jgi:hypothetical protein